MLTDALSKELAEHNINVNRVAPGAIWTPMMESALRHGTPQAEDLWQAYLATCKALCTFGREQTPQDVASAMLFLVSEESRNITGYVIYIDGGHKRAM